MKKRNTLYLLGVLKQSVEAAGFELGNNKLNLEKAKSLAHGHYSTNVAMLLAAKTKSNPREIAQKIKAVLGSEYFERVEIAGPGFINLFLKATFFEEELNSMIDGPKEYLHSSLPIGSEKTMVMDYSHPNIAKPMGVHHLLSTVIGDSIKHIYRTSGYKVVADNFIGDMGTQFGKLMHAIKKWGNPDEIEKDPITELQKLYVKFHTEAEEDESLDEAGREEYQKFETGDQEARVMWKKIVKWSLAEIQPIYDRLGVSFDVMNGESFYEEMMQEILTEGRKSGVIVEGEKGAWIIEAKGENQTPVLVRKSDGATLYATRDLARTKYWQDTWSPDLMVIVTDIAQEFHFKQVFYAVEKLGITHARNVNVNFGRMKFKDMKMSTRKGNILLLDKVLDESEQRALEVIKEKTDRLSDQEAAELATVMGINAIKYNILSQNRSTNITFEWSKILSFEGNSAPYLMYSIARAKSILAKADKEILSPKSFNLEEQSEFQLALTLMTYPDAVNRAREEFKPNHIANYLYILAGDFNTLYNALPILKADEDVKNSRLMLVKATVLIMNECFDLLGLNVPKKM